MVKGEQRETSLSVVVKTVAAFTRSHAGQGGVFEEVLVARAKEHCELIATKLRNELVVQKAIWRAVDTMAAKT